MSIKNPEQLMKAYCMVCSIIDEMEEQMILQDDFTIYNEETMGNMSYEILVELELWYGAMIENIIDFDEQHDKMIEEAIYDRRYI